MQGLIDFRTPGGRLETQQLEKGRVAFGRAVLEWQPQRLSWIISAAGAGENLEVNGRLLRAGSSAPLNHFDEIKVGQVRARFLRMPDVPIFRSKPCREVVLEKRRLMIGRMDASGSTAGDPPGLDRWQLDPDDDRSTVRDHVEIRPAGVGYVIHDRSPTGTYLNGAVFHEKLLVPGDRFVIGSYQFEFTGRTLCCVDTLLGARVESHDLSLTVPHDGRHKTILRNFSIEIKAGEFLGILGGSGQGKSTLMNLLAGLQLPSKGAVLIDGESIAKKLQSGSLIGFVPQDDIVHSELTVREALRLTARLRLAVSQEAIEALVDGTIKKLGLEPHAVQPIHSLSGGQRKRVNIATELLTRPAVLFLDEPTSGLDPENEESVVSTLQNLRLTGQTVVCTTHSLQKAYLFDRIAFVHAGQLLFLGNQDEAREHFLAVKDDANSTDTSSPVVRLDRIYKLVSQQNNGEKWHQKFIDSSLAPFSDESFPPKRRVFERTPAPARPGLWTSLVVLVIKQWRILAADKKNLQSIILQAVGIGTLAGWVGLHDPEFRFFACLIATLWFGCSNAAQTIVRELPIFCRERIAGLSLHPYILSKTVFLSLISWLQILMLLSAQALPVLIFGREGDPAHDILPASAGGIALFLLAFTLMGAVGVQIGLALSSLARTTTQATLWVPLALIPQILFSGFVVTRPNMPDTARLFSHVVPSAAAQHLIDLANVTDKRIPLMTDDTEVPMFFWTEFEKDAAGRWQIEPGYNENRLTPELSPGRRSLEGKYRELDEYNTSWQNVLVTADRVGHHHPQNDGKDYVTRRVDVGSGQAAGNLIETTTHIWPSLVGLFLWLLFTYITTWFGLSKAQPAPLRPKWMRRT